MKRNKSIFIIVLSMIMLLNSFAFAETRIYELEFNEHGFKNAELQSVAEQELISKLRTLSNVWETFPSKKNVDLEKIWTVKFSSTVNTNNIDGITIEKNNQFIPVRITKTKNDTMTVQPIDAFSGNSNYTMRIFLNNGKKYKMDFTTKSDYRSADKEPNNNYQSANEIYLNEIIQGSFSDGDYNDYYKIEIPYNGQLNLKAIQQDGGKISLYLYGPNGDDKYAISSDTSKSTTNITRGLQAGTYYIRVNYAYSLGNYTLENSFYMSEYSDDNSTSNYITSNEINLNDSFTGHLGYYSDYNQGNFNDYYKIELPEDGQLNLEAVHLGGKNLSLYLYGPNGNDNYAISSSTSRTTTNITHGLQAGTYYVRVYSEQYGAYKLENKYYPSQYANDNAVSNYITANQIGINDNFTGHIGYYSDYNRGNFNDYYKIVLPVDGELDIQAVHLDGKNLSLYLYGPNGNDNYAISSSTSRTTANIAKSLSSGTYYIRISSEQYGGYSLDTNFK